MLKAEGVSFQIRKSFLVTDVTIGFAPGRFHVIMGANGAGKSTLLKLLAGELKPTTGAVHLHQKNIAAYSKSSLAKSRAVLSQIYHLAFPVSVEEVVLMGRYPHFGAQPSKADWAICTEAMERMNVGSLRHRDYTTLSGGEAQKVQMSRVLAQIWNNTADEGKLLFLDEPVSHLDVKYQHHLLQEARVLCKNGTTVVAVLHDLNLALNFADVLYFMKGGAVVHTLDEPQKLSPAIIENVFDVKATVIARPDSPVPVVVF